MTRRFFSYQDLDGTRLQVGTLASADTVTVGFTTPGHELLSVELTPDRVDELIASLGHAREKIDRDVSYSDSLLWATR